nr:MAG TPA: Regulatory protein-modification, helix-turn-helix, transcriptional regulator, DNA [Caudoviricetes sp.]
MSYNLNKLTNVSENERKGGSNRLLITSTQAKAIRRKQADKKLTAKQAGEEIGVTQVTYRKIRDGGEVKPSVYQKAMEWLAQDY